MSDEAGPILVVEDEFLIAMQIQMELRRHGFVIAGVADRRARARALAQAARPALALVDTRLADGATGRQIVRDLHAMGVPCLYVSGNCPDDAEGWPALGCLHKPFDGPALRAAIAAALEVVAGRRPARMPSGFRLYGTGDDVRRAARQPAAPR